MNSEQPIVLSEGQEKLRETYDTNIFSVSYWCKDYNVRNAFPCTPLQRLVVAIYQLHQAIGWNDNVLGYKEYESFASSVCHFFMVGHCFDLDITDDLKEGVINFNEFETWPVDYKKLLKLIAEISQQVFYGEQTFNKGYTRKSRFDKLKLQKLLADVVTLLFSSIPSHKRGEALEQATNIMTKRL